MVLFMTSGFLSEMKRKGAYYWNSRSFERGDNSFHGERDVHIYFYEKVHSLHFSKWGVTVIGK